MERRLWRAILAALLVAAVMAAPGAAQAATVSAVAVADTWVGADSPTTTRGGSNVMRVSGSPEKIGYVKITVPQVPAGATVSSIVLKLTGAPTHAQPTQTISVRTLSTNNWTEQTTYNNRPALGARTLFTGTMNDGVIISVPMPSDVVPGGTYSFAILSAAPDDSIIASSEHGSPAARPTVVVNYTTAPPPPNQPPLVNAGPDQAITLPANQVTLNGTASDDGPFVTAWSKLSGPDEVTFADPAAQDTTATFASPGTYVLRLAADDGTHISVDDMTVVVNEQPPPPPPPPDDDLFSEHVGFGDPSFLAQPVLVTSAADSGLGTLRAAVAGDAPKHITFASDMVIHNVDEIPVGSNTIIDGRGHTVILDGTTTTGGLTVTDESKVTIAHLTLRNFGNLALTGSNDPYDAILIDNSNDVWIHHNDLSTSSDKAVGIHGGCVGVVVSWNHFHHQEQTFQIANLFEGEAAGLTERVSVHHNYFDGTGYRHPVISYGWAHVWNNYYRDFELYGARSERIAQMLFEDNVIMAIRNARVTLVRPAGDGCNDAGTNCDDRLGFLVQRRNVALPGSLTPVYQTNGSVFTPPYAYTPEPAGQALADAIVAGAGPH